MAAGLRGKLEEFLRTLNIQTTCVEHPPVLTVDQMLPHLQGVSGVVTKNLFLKDKKKKTHFLLTARHDRQVNLKALSGQLGATNLRLAEEAAMMEALKVGPGCATPLAVLFDEARAVQQVLDRDLVQGGHQWVHVHPMTNSATMGIRPEDLVRFLQEAGHPPLVLDLD
ncbi:prolyl-tRNA synthetase associated domain-containing protein 1 [Menidia menidia]